MELIQISSLLSIQMSEKISQMLTHFRSRFHVSCVFTVLPSLHTNTYAYLNTNTSILLQKRGRQLLFRNVFGNFFFWRTKVYWKSQYLWKKTTTMWTIKTVTNKMADALVGADSEQTHSPQFVWADFVAYHRKREKVLRKSVNWGVF